MKHKIRRFLALLLCAGMLFCAAPVVALGDEVDDLNDKLEQLQKESDALQAKVNAAKTEKARQEAIKEKTTQEITIMKNQIAALEEKIIALENKIASLEEEIAQKEEEIDGLEDSISENYDLFKRRMRAMYMSEHTSSLSLLLGAESFGDFLTASEYLKRVAQHDQDILDDLEQTLRNVEEAKAAVEEAKAAVEADRAELGSTKAQAEETRRQLDAKLSATVAEIQSIAQMEKEFLADIAAKQKEMEETQAEIDSIYESMDGEELEEFVGGAFMHPVPGYTYISSYYGWRFNGTDFHTGVDFTGANVNGKSVVASNAGNVIFTKTTYIPGRSYGKYIIVDHGGGYSTLYAHLSSVNVSVGDYVRKGQNIGNVGSTGWSTGPHLHFEIRINGKHTNPLPYLK